jgi:hypothetical protein
MKPKGRGLRVERGKLFLVEGELDDPTTPKPNVDPEELIELVRQLRVKLSTPPTELKRQSILERLHRGSKNAGSRGRCFGTRNAALQHQDSRSIFGKPIGDAAAHQAPADYDHIGKHRAKLLGPSAAASA